MSEELRGRTSNGNGKGGRLRLAVVLAMLAAAGRAGAQALPTATTALQLSVFGAAAERDPRLAAGARNTDVTLGVDFGFLPVWGIDPTLEVRGTKPVVKGDLANEEEFLVGLKVGKRLGPLRPYGNVLVGRGQIKYPGFGLPVPGQNVFYTESHSSVLSPGGGVDVDVVGGFALKVDAQFERYSAPVTVSGSAVALVATVGVVYRLDFDRGRIR